MFLPASPSQAAPKLGGCYASGTPCALSLPMPIILISSGACWMEGSGRQPPKSSIELHLCNELGGAPNISPIIRTAYGLTTPCMPSRTILKSGLLSSLRSALKSNKHYIRAAYWLTVSTTSTAKCWPFWSSNYRFSTEFKLIAGRFATVLKRLIVFVYCQMVSVRWEGAGPPLDELNLMPKSAAGPPGR